MYASPASAVFASSPEEGGGGGWEEFEKPVKTGKEVDAVEEEVASPAESAADEASVIELKVGICCPMPRYMANREPPPARIMTSSRQSVLQAEEGLLCCPVRRKVMGKLRHIL